MKVVNRNTTGQIIKVQNLMSSIQDKLVKAIQEGASLEYNIDFEVRPSRDYEKYYQFNRTELSGGFIVNIKLIK